MEMMRLEEKVFGIGRWDNLTELEDKLTMTELHRLFLAQEEKEYNHMVFLASLEGAKMEPWKDPDEETGARTSSFDEIKERAARRAAIENGEISADSNVQSLHSLSASNGFEVVEEDD